VANKYLIAAVLGFLGLVHTLFSDFGVTDQEAQDGFFSG
jgi:hypothetical protein